MRLVLLFLLVGCRFHTSSLQTPPSQKSSEAAIVLRAPDAAVRGNARAQLQRNAHRTIIPFDESAIAAQQGDCTAACENAIICSWSARRGAPHYALVDAATNALEVYDVKTCTLVPGLADELVADAPEPPPTGNGSVTITSDGIGDAKDGYYELFRRGERTGFVHITGAGTSDELIRPSYDGLKPTAGDVLAPRGRPIFYNFALTGEASFAFGHRLFGPGAHLRFYGLDGGFQMGAGIEMVVGDDDFVGMIHVEPGWGWPVAPGFVISLNVGLAKVAIHDYHAESDDHVRDTLTGCIPLLRLQTFLLNGWYASFDGGVALTLPHDRSSTSSTDAMQIPIVRISVGLDITTASPRARSARVRPAAAARH